MWPLQQGRLAACRDGNIAGQLAPAHRRDIGLRRQQREAVRTLPGKIEECIDDIVNEGKAAAGLRLDIAQDHANVHLAPQFLAATMASRTISSFSFVSVGADGR